MNARTTTATGLARMLQRIISAAVLVVTCGVVVLGLLYFRDVRRAQHQKDVIESITSSGGRIAYDWQLDEVGDFVRTATAPELSMWGTLVGADGVWNVHRVEFPKSGSDELLSRLKAFPQLRYLNLVYCFNISDNGLRVIPELRELRVLKLYGNNPSRMNNFTRGFDLSRQPRVSEDAIAHISRLKHIMELYLWDVSLSQAGVEELKRVRSLQRLGVCGQGVSVSLLEGLQAALPNCDVIGGSR